MKALLAEKQAQNPFIPRRPLKSSIHEPESVIGTSQYTPQIHLDTTRECSIPLSLEGKRKDSSRITSVPQDRGSQAQSALLAHNVPRACLRSVPTDMPHATMRSLSTTQDIRQEKDRMFVETSGDGFMWIEKLRLLHDEQLKTKKELESMQDIVKANDSRICVLEAVFRRQKAHDELGVKVAEKVAEKHGRGSLIPKEKHEKLGKTRLGTLEPPEASGVKTRAMTVLDWSSRIRSRTARLRSLSKQ